MLVWLLNRFAPLAERLEAASSGDSRVYLTARIALAAVLAFTLAVGLGPLVIALLRNKRVGERIDSASPQLNELHAAKRDTPTMGGAFIMAAAILATLLCADLSNLHVLLALVVGLAFAVVGAVDDWQKLRRQKRGLSARGKLLAQTILAAGVAVALWLLQGEHPQGTALRSPIGEWAIRLGVLFIPWAVLVIVGSSNAVNLTDGLDGLAAGCIVFAGGAFAVLAYLSGHAAMAEYLAIPRVVGGGELGVVMAALVGATLGFLWYNAPPAQIFMGDVGSLPLGALLGYVALAIRQEALLAIIGGVFVVETLSVIAQVASFKMTGKRVLACSPLHHHFQFRGMPETRIVVRFWIVAALLGIAGLACLKLR
ncbi:MAG: phospho-N-acetylmuramoyl-pentapeptide-transferase [Planctomyces sp.]|nr:phospho-N-acetylmuramoyl-pentapeptide-transferase [Planctomyces sp.]